MIQSISYGTYVFFAVFCVLSFFWSWFLAPETKLKTLEEMDQVFNDHVGEQDAAMRQAIRREIMPHGLGNESKMQAEADRNDGHSASTASREEQIMAEKRDGSHAFVESV